MDGCRYEIDEISQDCPEVTGLKEGEYRGDNEIKWDNTSKHLRRLWGKSEKPPHRSTRPNLESDVHGVYFFFCTWHIWKWNLYWKRVNDPPSPFDLLCTFPNIEVLYQARYKLHNLHATSKWGLANHPEKYDTEACYIIGPISFYSNVWILQKSKCSYDLLWCLYRSRDQRLVCIYPWITCNMSSLYNQIKSKAKRIN